MIYIAKRNPLGEKNEAEESHFYRSNQNNMTRWNRNAARQLKLLLLFLKIFLRTETGHREGAKTFA